MNHKIEITQEIVDKVIRRIGKGDSVSFVAKIVGIGPEKVREILNSHGVKLKPNKEFNHFDYGKVKNRIIRSDDV